MSSGGTARRSPRPMFRPSQGGHGTGRPARSGGGGAGPSRPRRLVPDRSVPRHSTPDRSYAQFRALSCHRHRRCVSAEYEPPSQRLSRSHRPYSCDGHRRRQMSFGAGIREYEALRRGDRGSSRPEMAREKVRRPAGLDVELDLLTLLERLVAAALDVGVVDEHVVARLPGDEPETLFSVEELHGTCCHYLLLSSRGRRTDSHATPTTLGAGTGSPRLDRQKVFVRRPPRRPSP